VIKYALVFHDEVGESVEKVQELGEKSKEIVKFVTVITGLAEQTNLLALNAAIESARAGEHGRGFAVVANEVKKLAEQSAQAAKEVSQLINVIQKDTEATVSTIQKNTLEVNRGSELAQEVGQGFEKLHESANHVVKRIEEVSGIYIELSHAVGDVIKGLNEVDQFACVPDRPFCPQQDFCSFIFFRVSGWTLGDRECSTIR